MSDQAYAIFKGGFFYVAFGLFVFMSRWSGSVVDKKEFATNLLLIAGWLPYYIFIVAPKAFYKFWANLPDEQSPTQK